MTPRRGASLPERTPLNVRPSLPATVRRARVPAVLALLAALSACTAGARSGRRTVPAYDPTCDRSGGASGSAAAEPAARPNPDKIPGTPSYRVVWEALAVERARVGQQGVPGAVPLDPKTSHMMGTPEFEVVLLDASYVATPDQQREDKGLPPSGHIARVSDAQMLDLIAALERLGFFRYAEPTGSARSLFASDQARGRITVDRDGESVTLLSLRGLGLQSETRAIPGIYAQAKEAISLLKNTVPTLRVKGGTIKPVDAGKAVPRTGADGKSGGGSAGGGSGK